ncbi:MAG TPA: ScyD/ScyE family protein [Dehalococcoidia bacterium]|nr:ScyD/ScyE family protein [Dehalococcoidia bacterium]
MKFWSMAAVAVIVLGGLLVAREAQAAPSAGTKLAGGFSSGRGMKVGPDGMIYIAEAGSGGDIVAPNNAGKSGYTGRISKINPSTGAVTVVADKLPSNSGSEGDAVGPADVAFVGNTLYYVQTHGGVAYGFPATSPTGVYRVNSNGTVTLVADIGAFNIANPVDDVKNKVQQDIEIGGNPYSMIQRDGALFVVDGNQNQVMKVTTSGTITRLAQFPGHPVTTGITYTGGGPFYVSALGQFPFAPADGRVYRVGYPTGSVTQVASGYSSLTNIITACGGQLYAVQFGDQSGNPAGIPWIPFSGKVLKVDPSTGVMTPIITGLLIPTGVAFDGTNLYFVNDGVSALGPSEVWSVANFCSVTPPAPTPTAAATQAPPAPAPTATPRGGVIAAPNTGDGSSAGADAPPAMWALVALVAGVAVLGGGIAAGRKRG